MKTKTLLASFRFSLGTARARRLWFCLGLGAAASGLIGSATDHRRDYVAHEWGTFTSVQGADGTLLDWRPLKTADLPGFVYDWARPGLNRQGADALTKAAIVTRQRMETPVIYFYADKQLEVDVTVKFPQGKITEWYPQAKQIGPAFVPPPPFVKKLDAGAHQVGVEPKFSFASLLLPRHAAKDSRIVWSDVKILPAQHHAAVRQLMPHDNSNSHYFAARATDAAFVRVDSLSRTNPAPEHDKFLFYRGVGNFSTPLRVTTDADATLTLTNTGAETLSHLFVLRVHDGHGYFITLDALSPNMQRAVTVDQKGSTLRLPELALALGQQMADALVREGLYAREAQAMVDTWKDSWFAEEGVRVLYTLPRAWTDATLPLTLDPAPKKLVRVMVGRAEVITPATQQELARHITEANDGDALAREKAQRTLQRLGRFAEPALRLATDSAAPDLREAGWKLLHALNTRTPEKRL